MFRVVQGEGVCGPVQGLAAWLEEGQGEGVICRARVGHGRGLGKDGCFCTFLLGAEILL